MIPANTPWPKPVYHLGARSAAAQGREEGGVVRWPDEGWNRRLHKGRPTAAAGVVALGRPRALEAQRVEDDIVLRIAVA